MMNRRTILTTALMLPIGYVVQGCASIPQVVSDANIIADGITAILPTIQALTGLGGGAYQTVLNAVNAIKSAASTLATATGQAAITAATAIPTAISTIAAAIANFKVPSWVSTVISAAQTVAPVIIAALGVLPRMAEGGGTGLTVAQARGILIAAAAK